MIIAGFDPKWATFPDYIIGITKKIWEGRDIASLREYYAPDIIVRMPGGISFGNESVVAGTMATLAEFPDRQLLADDVNWSGDPTSGMLCSHRIYCTATHLNDGAFGYRKWAQSSIPDDRGLSREAERHRRRMACPRSRRDLSVIRHNRTSLCAHPYRPRRRPGERPDAFHTRTR